MEEFIIVIRKHSNIGFIPKAYLVILDKNEDYLRIVQSVRPTHIKSYASYFSEAEMKLIKLIDEYSDVNLVKKFVRDKRKIIQASDFFNSIDTAYFDLHIKPFVERRIVQIIDILRDNKIRLFYKTDEFSNIYLSEQIKLEPVPAETVFNIRRERDFTKYFLSIFHEGSDISLFSKEGIILSNSPCRLLLEKQLFYFEDIDGKKLQPFFNKQYLKIEQRAEKKWFDVFVKPALKKYRVNTSGFEIKNLIPNKKAKLIIQKDISGRIVLVLQFLYDDRIFYPNHSGKDLVFFIEKQTSFYFERLAHDLDWENECLQKVDGLGLKIDRFGNFIPEIFSSDVDLQNYEIINWINLNIENIKNTGLIFEQNIDIEQFYFGRFNFNLKHQNTGKDWFDIFAIIEFEGFEIPFYKFKKHILYNNREFILPNQKIFILPEEWFVKYKNLLQVGKENNDLIQISKFHFTLVNEMVKDTNDKILNSLMQLTDFKLPETIELPQQVNATLRLYQKEGFFWMDLLNKNNFGGCLADDMGLGKTLQTITLLSKIYSNCSKSKSKPSQLDLFGTTKILENKPNNLSVTLIVMPVSLIINWENEFKKFNPTLRVLRFSGSNRTKEISDFQRFDIVLTSYGIIRNEYEWLQNYEFHYIILDESQSVNNALSKTYQALMALKSKHKLVLTGTPIENSLTDLWSQMNFVNTGLLGNFNYFLEEFVKPIEKEHDIVKQEQLQILIKPFILRRKKEQVAKDLPPVNEQVIFCEMLDEQEKIYEQEKSKIRNEILLNIEKDGIAKASFLAIQGLTRLRQIANHPVLLDKEMKMDSGKFEIIKTNIETLISEKHNVLIFSSFVKHLSLLEDYFKAQNWNYSLLTGEMSKENRQKAIDSFQNNTENRLFLISIKAGGVGLNLTAADYVFILDPWWNPAVELQAINRAHRIGQDKNVFVYRFISLKTVEQKIRQLQEEKAALAEIFINSNNPFLNFDKEKLIEFFE